MSGQLTGKNLKRASVSASSIGNNTLIGAVAGKRIKVMGVILVAANAVDVKFQSGAGGTDLTGLISLDAKGSGFVMPPPANLENHWIETAPGVLLNLSLSAGVQVSGCITYYEEE